MAGSGQINPTCYTETSNQALRPCHDSRGEVTQNQLDASFTFMHLKEIILWVS